MTIPVQITLPRYRDKPLVFTGERLAHASSRFDGQDRWTEISIFKTSFEEQRYALHIVGKSSVADEVDLVTTILLHDAAEILETLAREDRDGIEYLTRVARDALAEAAEADDEVRDAFEEWTSVA
ncbi:MAG: hypothetical protein GEU78_16275 [Actinobacteria bacterium]|nr:hypothetical protein [Actinomycetota bacterium]